jgi:hypothetical protein
MSPTISATSSTSPSKITPRRSPPLNSIHKALKRSLKINGI